MSPLAYIGQEDFAAGVLRSTARGLEPGVGVHNAINGLFDDDGDCYLRGPTRRLSAAVTPGASPLRLLWTGDLNGETVILTATADQFFRVDPATGVATALSTGPAAGISYPVKPAVVGGEVFFPGGEWFTTTPSYPGNINGEGADTGVWYPAALPGTAAAGMVHVCACANRLIYASGRVVRFSSYTAAGKPAPHTFGATDYHELPEGAVVTGLAAIRDTVMVFSTYGVWTITNLALDLTDDYGNPQQALDKILPELSFVSFAGNGIAEWEGRLVVPCSDQIYLMDTASGPTPIGNSIAPLYQQLVNGGYSPGGAKVWRSHYFMPMIDGSGFTTTVLACRLNRPVRGRMTYYPWTTLEGEAGRMVVGDVATTVASNVPELLTGTDTGWILSYRDLFGAEHAPPSIDTDGDAPIFELETRDFPTGNGQPNHVRELRVYYTLSPPETGEPDPPPPQIKASMSFGDEDVWIDLPEVGPPSPGINPIRWSLHQVKRARYVRARVRCEDPVGRLTIHRVQIGVRQASHQR